MRRVPALLLLVPSLALAEPKTLKPVLPPPPRPDDSLAPARVDPALLDRSYERAQTTRNVGVALAAPGIALTVLGGVLIGFGATRDSHAIFDQLDKYLAGAITDVVGVVIGIPGVYYWSTGQDDMDSVVWRRRQLMPR
jgi:hypothetical protein